MRYTTSVEKEAAGISYVLGAKATVTKHNVELENEDDLKLTVVERDHDIIIRSPVSYVGTIQGFVGKDGLDVYPIVRRFTTFTYAECIRDICAKVIKKHYGLVKGETNLLEFLDGHLDPVGLEFTITLFKTPIAIGEYADNGTPIFQGGYRENNTLVEMEVLEKLQPGLIERCTEIAKSLYRKPVEYPEHMMDLYNYKSLDSVDINWYENCTDLTNYRFALTDNGFVEIAGEQCMVFKKGDIECGTEHALFTLDNAGPVLGLVIGEWVVIPRFVLKPHTPIHIDVITNPREVIAAIENAPTITAGDK